MPYLPDTLLRCFCPSVIRRRLFLGFASLLCFTGPASAGSYTLQDLGLVGDIYAYGINASGQVIGMNRDLAYRTSGLTTTALGTLGGQFSRPYGINASGQIVGFSSTPIERRHAFRTSATGLISDAGTDLGTLGGLNDLFSYSSTAYGINASGQTIGDSEGEPATYLYRAFRTTANGLVSDAGTDLGSLGGTISNARGINDSGQTVGYSETGSRPVHAFRTTSTGLISDPGADIGTFLGGTNSFAYGINASGQTVGYSDTGSGSGHAFRTTANGLVGDPGADLGTLGGASYAVSINASGQTVGGFTTAGNVRHAAFIDSTGPMLDLNDLIPSHSGWVLSDATGINDAGQITGDGFRVDGNGLVIGQSAFLLTLALPEPTSISILLVGGMAMFMRRRRAKRS